MLILGERITCFCDYWAMIQLFYYNNIFVFLRVLFKKGPEFFSKIFGGPCRLGALGPGPPGP
jgi:hypothetical protein